MVTLITPDDVRVLLQKKGLRRFFMELIERLHTDFSRWLEFQKTPRHATHYPHGVIELMPISDDQYYTFKYVNGHPNNPAHQKLTVAAFGVLAEVASGYPLMIAEMTLLTALRTAATSALASSYLAQSHAHTMAIIGTGAQSEFQALAHHFALGVKHIQFFDQDPLAMKKFAANLASFDLKLTACQGAAAAVAGAQIITTATASKIQANILDDAWINPGIHINAIGGDCPGKTELDPKILLHGKIVVENAEQTAREGEVQQIQGEKIYAELWEIITRHKAGRKNDQEIFIFDSVGFALEDYSILRFIYDLAQEYRLGQSLDLIPSLKNPKNLFGECLLPR